MSPSWGKILAGAGLGFLVGGPLGGILGAVVASGLSEGSGQTFGATSVRDERFLFFSNLTVLLTLVAKADGRVTPAEAKAISRFFTERLGFGEAELATVRRIMKETLRVNPSPEAVASQFAAIATMEERLALLRLVWMVAEADGLVDPREEQVISRISRALGIRSSDRRGVGAEFQRGADAHYETLGVDRSASDDEIKAAYRRMAKQYHPDRVAHLGPEFTDMATDKFAQINAAYDAIRKERGF